VKTSKTKQPEQDSQYGWDIRTGQAEQDRKSRTGRTGPAEKDRQNRAGDIGKAEQDCQDRTSTTGLPGQDCQERICQESVCQEIARTRLPGEGYPDRAATRGCQHRTNRI
jgi:hypothetical protein